MIRPVILLSAFLGALSASAGPIPYPTSGTQNSATYVFKAATTGDIIAYFYGSGAGYTEYLGLDVNGAATGITGLTDKTTSVGQSLDLGHANAGDTLVFFINVVTTTTTWYSNSALNGDGANHIYSTSFAGNGTIPAGTYIGFEDLPASTSDWNYTDFQLVFTTAALATTAPEPSMFALLAVSLAGLAGFTSISWRKNRQ